MDQSVIAGVGNLLADEALWRARLSPVRPAGDAVEEELDRLRREIRAATRSAIRKGGVHTGDVIAARERGERLPALRAPAERATVGGRTTYWCPAEQTVRVGDVLGPTGWRRVAQEDIDAFAAIAGDKQWIHVDVERARRESPFGTTIAHGTLTLALIDGFRDELVPVTKDAQLGVNLGYDRVRFPVPVPAGGEVRATMEIVDMRDRGGGWVEVVQRFTVELRDTARPACVADSVIRVLRDQGS